LRLGGRNHGSIGDQREMNAGIGDEVGLEFGQVDVERAVESEGSSDGRHDCGCD
jgi:hypothetical protein